jgi:predicted Fe-S protein YdhL (DUF1289 family)
MHNDATERTYPVDPNLEFKNVVVPVDELGAEDYASVLKGCPLITDDRFEWYAVINTDKQQIWHLICTPKAWIKDGEATGNTSRNLH